MARDDDRGPRRDRGGDKGELREGFHGDLCVLSLLATDIVAVLGCLRDTFINPSKFL